MSKPIFSFTGNGYVRLYIQGFTIGTNGQGRYVDLRIQELTFGEGKIITVRDRRRKTVRAAEAIEKATSHVAKEALKPALYRTINSPAHIILEIRPGSEYLIELTSPEQFVQLSAYLATVQVISSFEEDSFNVEGDGIWTFTSENYTRQEFAATWLCLTDADRTAKVTNTRTEEDGQQMHYQTTLSNERRVMRIPVEELP